MADVLNTAPSVARVIKVDSSCGCTLTRTTIDGLSPDDIVALSNKEIYLTKAILDAKEAKMLGVPERGLMELLTSKVKDIKEDLQTEKIDRQSIIMPYTQRQQRSFVNANYFTVESAQAPADAGVGSVPASAWDLKVNLGPSWAKTDLQNIERYFVPGSTLQVMTWDSVATKNARTLVFTILRAVNADAGAVHKATVTVYAPYTAAGWVALAGSEKNVWHPTFGVAQTGANSVNNYESYCPTQPSNLSNKLIVDWLQTTRESYCREQAYEEVLDAILKGQVNDYLKAFKYQSIADQQKQQKARYQREWYNAVFYGAPIDLVNQTTANWKSLPIIYDPVNSSCPLAYKASAEGIFTKLLNANRVVDLAGAKLNLDYIMQQLYYLRRNREADGDNVQIIDAMTNRYVASMIQETMFKYYQTRYGIQEVRYAQIGQKITHDNVVLFNYNVYDIPDAGVQWAVFQDDYFNDLADAFASPVVGWDFRTRANALWFIDWSDISIGVAESKQVTRKNPDPSTADLYKCVIDTNIRTYDLRSKTWTVMVDRPQRHLIIYNFLNGCSIISAGNGCLVPQTS